MTLLKQFLELGLDCSPIGLGPGPSQGGYFCTPKGLTVLGWEGVDGIHYGRIRGYGDMVFAVNPMPAGEQHVRPLAGSFRDFLRLLLACGSTTTLEQAGDWTREQFDTYLRAPENAVADVEIAGADGGAGHPHDGVAGALQGGDGPPLQGERAVPLPDQSVHGVHRGHSFSDANTTASNSKPWEAGSRLSGRARPSVS